MEMREKMCICNVSEVPTFEAPNHQSGEINSGKGAEINQCYPFRDKFLVDICTESASLMMFYLFYNSIGKTTTFLWNINLCSNSQASLIALMSPTTSKRCRFPALNTILLASTMTMWKMWNVTLRPQQNSFKAQNLRYKNCRRPFSLPFAT